ncbi:MAG: LysR family transcriptional regulator [Synechococcales cyanobacterium]
MQVMQNMSNSNVTLAQLQVFLSVVDQSSFTLAAEALGMTQSGVSQAIATLEALLKGALFVRDRQGISLTHLGEKILPHARAALQHIDCLEQEATAISGLMTGQLRIGSIVSIATVLLPPLLKVFSRKYPDVRLSLLEGADPEIDEWLLSGLIDIGFCVFSHPNLESHRIAVDEMLVVVPEHHLLTAYKAITPRQLAREPFLMPVAGCEPLIQSFFSKAGVIPQVRLEIREMTTLISLVKEGLGVSIMPQLLLTPLPDGIKTIRLKPNVQRQIMLVLNPGQPQNAATKAFIQELKPELGNGS